MPLEKGSGRQAIAHNICEMEAHGHPKKQAMAAALHTALDTGDSMELHSTTAMTAAEVNKKNEKYWGGEDGNMGPAASEASAPMLAGTKVVPVWHGHTDEVSPTQSDPPDRRSDNLLERGHGGIPGTEGTHDDLVEGSEAMEVKEHGEALDSVSGLASAAHAGAEVGRRLASGEIVDSLLDPYNEERSIAKMRNS
jgi:hypothetical protein